MKLMLPTFQHADRVCIAIAAFVAGVIVTWVVMRMHMRSGVPHREGFDGGSSSCNTCGHPKPCRCNAPSMPSASASASSCATPATSSAGAACPVCPPMPDMSRYVLRSSIPPCPPVPDLTRYILKSEVPALPDMSKYVMKSSVKACPPCIASCSKPCEIGACPSCPVMRCPPPRQCPTPAPCDACPPCERQRCPNPDVKCKAVIDYTTQVDPVRPSMAGLSGFGL